MKIERAKGGIISLFICLILILTLLSAGIGIAAAADPIVSIKPAVKDVNVYEDFSIFIEVDPNGNTVETALLNLTYDPTKVSITNVVMNGADFPINSPGDATVAGQITNIMGLNTATSGLTTIANLTEIRMHADAAGTFTVGISGDLTKPPGDPLIPVTMNTGEVRIKSPDEPLDITILHPNGGESIPIKTQVQVSAHATGDTAVTSVTFSYSNNSGSDWNSIGAGTRVSGTDKDGIWNITWNTNSLGAGSNYLIKAVVGDGTSSGEDQSNSTFSLITCTPPSTPTLNDPGTTDNDGSYTLSWSSVSGATSYTLEEDTSDSFGSPTIVYSGSGTSTQITGRSNGTYYYRVKACNACGCSGWSNIENIEVSMLQDEEWNQTFGGTGCDITYSVQQTSDSGFILTGYTESYGAGNTDFWLIKTDSEGNKEWDKTYGDIDNNYAFSVVQTSDSGYILTGYTEPYDTPNTLVKSMGPSVAGDNDIDTDIDTDVYLVKTDSNGNKQWDKTIGGTDNDKAFSIQQTIDGCFIFTGYTNSYGVVSSDSWLVKIKGNKNNLANGAISIGSVTVDTGDTVILPITIANITNLRGITLDVIYDPNVATISAVSANDTIPSSTVIHNMDTNKVSIELTNPDNITVITATPLIDIAFQACENTGTTGLELQNVELTDDIGLHAPDMIINGSITVCIKGDFNYNDRVDIGDVAKVAFMVAGKVTPDPRADFNNNGRVDVGDAAKISFYLASKLDEL